MNAKPYILFKKNVNPKVDDPSIWGLMHRHFKNNNQEYMDCYHKRSNVETVFSMVKVRLGEFLKCKNHDAQKCELLMKFICHNICCLIQEIFERNVDVDFRKCLYDYMNESESEDESEGESETFCDK